MPPPYIGRFAPSPTGPLHAGSLVAALASFLDARAHGGQWLLRIEDLDTPRNAPGALEHIEHTLVACGLQWDDRSVQSQRTGLYTQALSTLQQSLRVYPCACTRKEIADSIITAPSNSTLAHGAGSTLAHGAGSTLAHGASANQRYPGTCRNGMAAGKQARAQRFAVLPCTVLWHDRWQGPQQQDVAQECGDFVLHRADGFWAYQHAVVVDDGAQGITHVVRGADLMDSTARQIQLQHALGLPTPHYMHVPVVYAADGQKLSKQTGAQALDLRTPEQAVSALATAWSALGFAPITAAATPAAWLQQATAQWAARFSIHT